jgi:hypothetical protein
LTVGIPNTVLLVEAVYAVIFMTLLTLARKNGGGRDDALWGLVWATRLFASLNGSRHLSGNSSELFMYLGLQACSGLSLIVILARYERKVFKDKLMRRLLLHMTHVEIAAPSRSLPGAMPERH